MQAKLIAFVNSHGGIFATPTSDGGVWIYIPHHNRNTGRNDVDRYKARTFGQARAHLGY